MTHTQRKLTILTGMWGLAGALAIAPCDSEARKSPEKYPGFVSPVLSTENYDYSSRDNSYAEEVSKNQGNSYLKVLSLLSQSER